MPTDLSDAERETLMYHRGGVGEIMSGGDGLRGVARAEVAAVIAAITDEVDDRVRRLVLLDELRKQTESAHAELLSDVIAGRFEWHGDSVEQLGSVAWQPYEKSNLAECAGVHPATLAALTKRICQETFDAAVEKLGGAS